jgi:hypothetical protein
MDLFIRKINILHRRREYPPLLSYVSPDRRALVNEISFRLFKKRAESQQAHTLLPPFAEMQAYLPAASALARDELSRIEHVNSEDVADPNAAEVQECFEQTERILRFFQMIAEGKEIVISPRFRGCGIIDTCYGDVYIDGCLFELKAGDRQFRSIDIRQLLTYGALNKLSGTYKLTTVGLFNPRIGVSWIGNIQEVCQEVSGRQIDDFFDELIRVISSGDISR